MMGSTVARGWNGGAGPARGAAAGTAATPGRTLTGMPANRLTPLRFVLAFGAVSLLADAVYEGGRAIVGPYLAALGASATAVGAVTGAGEAVALVFRLATGQLADRTGRHWALTITGYALTVAAVPLLALATAFWPAAALVVLERFGKAVRAPARDTMLSYAGSAIGQGRTFAVHEALDQVGALAGPLAVAAVVAASGYRSGFAVLALPGLLALACLAWLRAAAPRPGAYQPGGPDPAGAPGSAGSPGAPAPLPPRFWAYAAFTALTMAGLAPFGVLSYHLQARGVLAPALIPLAYALAMGASAPAALAAGWLYDRAGLRVLAALPVLSAAVPFLALGTAVPAVWAGAAAWGVVTGVHESVLRAAVADLVPAARRGLGYGGFTAVYGLAALAGGAASGALYDRSPHAAAAFALAMQALALAAYAAMARARGR